MAMGQQEVIGLTITLPAGGTIAKGKLVKLSSGSVVVTTAITDCALGVALQSVTSGQACPVQITGIALCVNGSAGITVDAEVMPAAATSTGEVDSAAGATGRSIGVALATVAAGEYVPVLLALPAAKRPPLT